MANLSFFGLPWFDWLFFVFGLVSIGFILWFCLKKNHESYDSNTPKQCLVITVLSIILILLTIWVILAYI